LSLSLSLSLSLILTLNLNHSCGCIQKINIQLKLWDKVIFYIF
jgi:hypothetical protein